MSQQYPIASLATGICSLLHLTCSVRKRRFESIAKAVKPCFPDTSSAQTYMTVYVRRLRPAIEPPRDTLANSWWPLVLTAVWSFYILYTWAVLLDRELSNGCKNSCYGGTLIAYYAVTLYGSLPTLPRDTLANSWWPLVSTAVWSFHILYTWAVLLDRELSNGCKKSCYRSCTQREIGRIWGTVEGNWKC